MKKIIWKEDLSLGAIILFCICAADLISTSIILSLGGGELNPLFNFIFNKGGIGLFVVAKLSSTLLCIFIIELSRTKELVSVKRIRNYYLGCIILYLGIYAYGFFPQIV